MQASCQQSSFGALPRCCIPTSRCLSRILDRAIVLNRGRAPRKAHQALANGDAQSVICEFVIMIERQHAQEDRVFIGKMVF
jgi:hypothetical protein